MEKRKSVTARITGRVQGVSYRAWTKAEAETLGLTGWVRNEMDGSVTALIAGPEDVVAAMIERLRQGPRLAVVASVTIKDANEIPDRFRITG